MTVNKHLRQVLLAVFNVVALANVSGQPGTIKAKPRLIVLTDISSLAKGEAEPDDGQLMIRLMLYANDLDLEGLIATSNMRHGQRTRPELIRQVIEAYSKVRPNLLLHDRRYPEADELASIVKYCAVYRGYSGLLRARSPRLYDQSAGRKSRI